MLVATCGATCVRVDLHVVLARAGRWTGDADDDASVALLACNVVADTHLHFNQSRAYARATYTLLAVV